MARGTMLVGLVSVGLAEIVPPPHTASISGFAYFLVVIPKWLAGRYRQRRARQLARPGRKPA